MDYLDQHKKRQLEDLIAEQEKIIAKAKAEKERLERILQEQE